MTAIFFFFPFSNPRSRPEHPSQMYQKKQKQRRIKSWISICCSRVWRTHTTVCCWETPNSCHSVTHLVSNTSCLLMVEVKKMRIFCIIKLGDGAIIAEGCGARRTFRKAAAANSVLKAATWRRICVDKAARIYRVKMSCCPLNAPWLTFKTLIQTKSSVS